MITTNLSILNEYAKLPVSLDDILARKETKFLEEYDFGNFIGMISQLIAEAKGWA